MNISLDWKQIPFTVKNYFATPDGKIFSNARMQLVELSCRNLSVKSPRWAFDAKVLESRTKKSNLVRARIIFFCFRYPAILKKELSDMTWKDYQKMPYVVHLNGDTEDDRPSNLFLVRSRRELCLWNRKYFPEKFKKTELLTA